MWNDNNNNNNKHAIRHQMEKVDVNKTIKSQPFDFRYSVLLPCPIQLNDLHQPGMKNIMTIPLQRNALQILSRSKILPATARSTLEPPERNEPSLIQPPTANAEPLTRKHPPGTTHHESGPPTHRSPRSPVRHAWIATGEALVSPLPLPHRWSPKERAVSFEGGLRWGKQST